MRPVRSLLRVIAATLLCLAPLGALPTINKIADLRRLTSEQAKLGYPVHLRAVVTYYAASSSLSPSLSPTGPDMFVQDETAGIFVNLPRWAPTAETGQLIEIDGISEQMDFAPQIGHAQWKVVGQASLPEAQPVSFEQMVSTEEDSQFVEIRGIVRTAEQRGDELILSVAMSGGRLQATVPQASPVSLDALPDAEVRLRGICGAQFNVKNQLTGILLYVAGLDQVTITRPAPANPFAASALPISTPLKFQLAGVLGHRIHVRGAVTFQEAGSYLYISDGTDGLRIESRQSTIFHAGDLVDVLGFPQLAGFTPVLEDATLRRYGKGPPLQPLSVTAGELLKHDYDSALVSIQAHLLKKSLMPNSQRLLLQNGDTVFNGSVEAGQPDPKLVTLHEGADLRLTGICVVQRDKDGHNAGFRLLIDEFSDIDILSQPPWWTLQHALQMLGLVVLLAVAALAWVAILRRRVRLQTADIDARYHREAILKENYQRLFAHHPHPLWVFDMETYRFLAVNDAAVAQYGYSAEEFLGMTIFEIRPSAEVPRLKQDLMQVSGLQTGDVWQHRRKDGSLIDVEIAAHELRFDGKPARVVMATDVTEREKTRRLDQGRREVVDLIAQGRPLERIMARLIETVETDSPGLRLSVVRLEDTRLRYLASSLPTEIVQATNGLPTCMEASEDGALWGAAVVGEQVADPFWSALRRQALGKGFQVCWPTPICSAYGQMLGAFAVCQRGAPTPSPKDRDLIAMAAQIASVAIEQSQLHDRLVFQAQHDALTGLPNLILLQDRLEQCMARSRRTGTSFAILQIDLDRFKLINDLLGHAAGDILLKTVAERLSSSVRETDTLARVGGDEMTLLLTDLRSPREAERVASQLLRGLQAPVSIQGNEVFVTASIGIALYPEDGIDPRVLIKKADAAMYRAKNTGKNRWCGFAPELEVVENRLELENDLHRALERNELEVFYQPLFHASRRSVAGMEALLRWRHPRLGLVPASQFIPIAEQSGLMVPIGTWVLREACRRAREFQPANGETRKVSINVSAVQFACDEFVQLVSSVLADTGLPPACLELEITESVIMHDLDRSARQMAELRALGVSIAIDDFGTGYSALSYLQRLPVDNLKIDRSFVKEMVEGPSPGRLVQAIVTMAHALGVKVTAEGVETDQQLAVLQHLGCDQVQGYLLGKPRPLAQAISGLPQELDTLPKAG